ncbi:MAG: prepilin-type N-terminal cleavage/methylation domain-containing protein [Nitrospinae bacterium]|nr:prepilin-type N-terminal cleavage/methylation domain-containing protein [Nitrospinota bacterium]
MQGKKGFSLVELLIVVAIIGILAAIAIPAFAAYREKAYCAAIKSDVANLSISEEAYFIKNAAYTSDFSGMPDFDRSAGVTIMVNNATTQAWDASGSHSNCPFSYNWDSTSGGLRQQ